MNINLFENSNEKTRILITGGAGFIGSALIRNLLTKSKCTIFNLDKISYASDLKSIEDTLHTLGKDYSGRYKLLKVDISNMKEINSAVEFSNPDYVFHLAAESHVDKSIDGPRVFMESNIIGTFNLLESIRTHFNSLNSKRKESFRFLHISTDEVFGSLENLGNFDELTRYDPRSPYSASKASSDHLVNAWHHTYGLPTLVTNCSNNYGPWQNTEKLIPKIIFNGLNNRPIPIYGDGTNIRDWLFVEDHIDGLINVMVNGEIGQKYCIGGNEEKTNNQVTNAVCELLDEINPQINSHKNLITYVKDRLGHDKRYAINSSKIREKLNWAPKYSFKDGLRVTVLWYFKKYMNPNN